MFLFMAIANHAATTNSLVRAFPRKVTFFAVFEAASATNRLIPTAIRLVYLGTFITDNVGKICISFAENVLEGANFPPRKAVLGLRLLVY